MPVSTVPRLYQVVIDWTGIAEQSGRVVNVLHYQEVAGGADPSNDTVAQVMAQRVKTGWEDIHAPGTAALRTSYAATVAPSQVSARRLDNDSLPAFAPTGALVGTSGSDVLPPEVACCASFRTGLVGPSRRGRAYLPPPTVNNLLTARFNAGYINRVLGFWEWMRTFNTLPSEHLFDLVVWSRQLDSAAFVTSVSVNTSTDTIRKRGQR